MSPHHSTIELQLQKSLAILECEITRALILEQFNKLAQHSHLLRKTSSVALSILCSSLFLHRMFRSQKLVTQPQNVYKTQRLERILPLAIMGIRWVLKEWIKKQKLKS